MWERLLNSEGLDKMESDVDKFSGEGPKAPNETKVRVERKRNYRLSGAVRRALEDLVFSLWEASADGAVRDALVRWKARNL